MVHHASRALLYLRQSDTDGAGERSLSLDSQASVLRADAARLRWTVVDEIRDPDLKGYDERRPGLLQLYDRVRAGDIEIVAFWKLDRLARLLRLQENVLHELQMLGVEVWSNQDPNIGNPLFRQVLGAFNEELTRMISANVRRALREKARRRQHHGRVPYGAERTPEGQLVPGEFAWVVLRAYELRAEGRSFEDIHDWLFARGVLSPTGRQHWGSQMLRNLLSNPAYKGQLRLGEIVIDDAYEPIVPVELWERAQAVTLEGRFRAPRQKPMHSWLESLILHECGAPMYLDKGKPGHALPAYRCRAGTWHQRPGHMCVSRPRYIGLERAERLAWDAIVADFCRLRPSEEVYEEAKRNFRDEAPAADMLRREAVDRQQRLASRRARVEDLYLSGVRDRVWFDAEDARLIAEEQEVARSLAELPEPPDVEQLEAIWHRLVEMRDVLAHIELADRGTWLRSLGVAIASPAGYPDMALGSRPGKKPDAGKVTIRYRPELRPFLEVPGLCSK
jgi:DNA invertase Pin-like site-specific DNA recombinase